MLSNELFVLIVVYVSFWIGSFINLKTELGIVPAFITAAIIPVMAIPFLVLMAIEFIIENVEKYSKALVPVVFLKSLILSVSMYPELIKIMAINAMRNYKDGNIVISMLSRENFKNFEVQIKDSLANAAY